MAQPDIDTNGDLDVTLVDVDPPPPSELRRRRRPRIWFAAAAAAAAVVVTLVAVRVADDDADPNVATEPPPETPAELPRLLIGEVPAPLTLANVESLRTMEDGVTEPLDENGDPLSDDEAPEVVTNEGDGPSLSHGAYYSEPVPGDDGLAHMSLTVSQAGDESFVGVGGGRDVTVRGQDGRIESSEIPSEDFGPVPTIKLEWPEAPGVTVIMSVTNTDLTEEDLIAAAETVYEASDEEWAEAQHLNDTPSPGKVEALVPGDAPASVTLPIRGAAVYLTADGQVCTTAVDGRGQVPPECADPDGERATLFRDRVGFPAILSGVLPDGATKVVASQDGVDIEAQGEVGPAPAQAVFLDPTADGDRTLYAVSVTWNTDLLTFLDAEGRTVETVPLDITPKF